jgi:DNA-binding NtrC family response regulator
MRCLIVASPQKSVTRELEHFLRENRIGSLCIDSPALAVEELQTQHFDVVILDARTQGLKIDQAIRLLKGCDPSVRIIVRTDENSRQLEGKARKEQIFYYHVDSLGIQDLQLALVAALGIDPVKH